ncbi:MAG: hypothetical protein KKC77_19815 [Proteobacteria bacterium]|nr:hypothetical protein [Pseudomonadota bacterium]
MVNKYENVVDGANSEWNEAMFKMMRLHKIQTEINVVKMNPLSKYELTGQYNYVAWFNLLKNLYDEGKAKYKKVELEEVDTIREVADNIILKCPIHQTRVSSGYGGNKPTAVFNKEYWDILRKLLEVMETKIKLYNDKHGLSTKNTESMDGRSILR